MIKDTSTNRMANPCTQCGSEISESAIICAICDGTAQNAESWGPTVFESMVATWRSETTASPSISFAPTLATDSDLKGIGGWLILQVIALALAPLFDLAGIYSNLNFLYGVTYQPLLAARPGLAFLILFQAATNATFLIALIGLNVLFYKTRRSFPRTMITYLVAAFVIALCNHLWTMHFYSSVAWIGVLQRFVAASIWVPYFLQSRRVGQTFVD